MGDNDTVADVVREMAAIPFHSEVYGETVQGFAARIEAAHAREVEALRLRAEAAEADARRYRWLRNKSPVCMSGGAVSFALWRKDSDDTGYMDAAIDAAIASGGEEA